MTFQIGDRVVHPVYGVGTVKMFTEQQFGGTKMRQYYQVTTGGPTVWVPLDEQGHTVLRGIGSKASLGECRGLLAGMPVPFENDRKLRQFEIAARLKGGLMPALCQVVRDLRAWSWGTPLGVAENLLLKKISKALCEEWAASDGVSSMSALHEIEDLLQKGSHSWIPKAGVRKRPPSRLTNW